MPGEAYTKCGSVVEDYRIPLGRHEILSDPRIAGHVVEWIEAGKETVNLFMGGYRDDPSR